MSSGPNARSSPASTSNTPKALSVPVMMTLDVSSVGAARAAIAKQTGLDTVLNIRPAFLIVPASLELKAEQPVVENLVPAATASVVPQSIQHGVLASEVTLPVVEVAA